MVVQNNVLQVSKTDSTVEGVTVTPDGADEVEAGLLQLFAGELIEEVLVDSMELRSCRQLSDVVLLYHLIVTEPDEFVDARLVELFKLGCGCQDVRLL